MILYSSTHPTKTLPNLESEFIDLKWIRTSRNRSRAQAPTQKFQTL